MEGEISLKSEIFVVFLEWGGGKLPSPGVENHQPQENLLDLSEKERELLEQLSQEPRHIDELIKECSLPPGKVGEILMKLQIKGLIRELPGKTFVAGQ